VFTPFHKPSYTYPYGRSVDETTTRDVLLIPDLHPGVLGLDPQHEVVWAVIPSLVVVASFSAEVGQTMMVIQATTGSGNVASGEN
jgi:hypothetical protein